MVERALERLIFVSRWLMAPFYVGLIAAMAMGTLDFGGVKLKLVASISAISTIHLLKSFMKVEQADKTNLMWLVITHMAFVLSGVLLALVDYVTERSKEAHKA